MSVYNLVAANGYGMVTESASCLPSSQTLKNMYGSKCVMYKDGKKLTLAAALEELAKNAGPEEPGRKKEKVNA